MTRSFSERLDGLLKERKTLLAVGLDPRPECLPEPLRQPPRAEALKAFLWGIVEATREHCVAYKIQLGSFLAFGADGVRLLPELCLKIGPDHLSILDIKAGDIPSTMELYRRGIFHEFGFDAMTIHPYLGWDSVDAAMGETEKGLFVLLHTSNPGARDIQEARTAAGVELWQSLLPTVHQLAERGNVGVVVGATYPETLTIVRRALGPTVPLLVPGVGAQGGALEEVLSRALGSSGGALLVNSSRGILFASPKEDWKEAAGKEALRLTEEMRSILKRSRRTTLPADRPRR